MNDEVKAICFQFIVHRSYLIVSARYRPFPSQLGGVFGSSELAQVNLPSRARSV
jgi:hypothetical protein